MKIATKKQTLSKAQHDRVTNALILILFFQNTGYKQGKPGMKEIYWIPLEEVTSQPEPPAVQGLPGETAIATGAWTVTNGFIKLNNDLFKGSELNFKSEGDVASPALKTEVAGDVIGFDPEIIERHTSMLGVPGVLVIKDNTCPTLTYWVVGCQCDPCFFMFDFKSDRVGGTNGKKTALMFQSACKPFLWSQEANELPLSTEAGV